MNLKLLEQETWADRLADQHSPIVGTRVKLFELLGVPNNIMEQMLFTKKFEEVSNRYKTFESLRQFKSLPKWIKKRIKFRFKHQSEFPEFDNFIFNLTN